MVIVGTELTGMIRVINILSLVTILKLRYRRSERTGHFKTRVLSGIARRFDYLFFLLPSFVVFRNFWDQALGFQAQFHFPFFLEKSGY